MNGIHDMGGMQDFGPIDRAEHEWLHSEQMIHSMMGALRAAGIVNIDEFRHGIERMEPERYLTSSYYERWLESLLTNLSEKGVLTRDELAARVGQLADGSAPPAVEADSTPRQASASVSPRRESDQPPRFKVGDEVRTLNRHPVGHTRLPRYARGKRGVIHRINGVHVFPDTHAHGLGEQPQPLYSVRFAGDELWGADADPKQHLYLDLWESYLEPA